MGISQSLQFPSVYGAQRKVNKSKVLMQEQQYQLDERYLKREVSKSYYTIVYWQNVVNNYHYLDSLYQQFSIAASRRYEVGETNYLEKLTATSKQKEIELLLNQVRQNIEDAYIELNKWIQTNDSIRVEETVLSKVDIHAVDTANHPGLMYYKQAVHLSENTLNVEKQRLLPDLHLSYFQGTNNGVNAQIYQGFQAGIGIPLFFGAQKSKIGASKVETELLQKKAENYSIQLQSKYNQLKAKLSKYQEAINYYEQNGKTLSHELINTSTKAFQNGEIDFVQLILSLENAKNIEMTYLENLYNYDKTVLGINYLMN